MTVIYSASALVARMNAVLNLIDANGTPGLRLLNSTNQTMALVAMTNPAGTVNGSGVLTFNTPVSAPLIFQSGQIVSGDVEDGLGNVIVSGLTVGTNSSSFDIFMSNTTVSSGQAVTLTFATITGR